MWTYQFCPLDWSVSKRFIQKGLFSVLLQFKRSPVFCSGAASFHMGTWRLCCTDPPLRFTHWPHTRKHSSCSQPCNRSVHAVIGHCSTAGPEHATNGRIHMYASAVRYSTHAQLSLVLERRAVILSWTKHISRPYQSGGCTLVTDALFSIDS